MRASSIKARLEGLTRQINQLRNEARLVGRDDIFYYHSKISQLKQQERQLTKQLERMK